MARSNRQLTQFAVNTLQEYLDHEVFYDARSAGNTTVYAAPMGGEVRYGIELFGKEIFRLILDSSSLATTNICLYAGDFYDSKGRPSRTTRERLNGLLDLLGNRGLISEGTRVFLTDDGCRVGKGDQSQPLDKDNPIICLSTNFKKIPDSIIAKGLV